MTHATVLTLIAACLSLGACGASRQPLTGDVVQDVVTGAKDAKDSVAADTAGADGDGDASADDLGAVDTGVADAVNPCDPSPCGEAPATRCSLHLEGHTHFTTQCTPVDGEAVCTVAASLTPCDDGQLCVDGACTATPAPCEFPVGDRLGITTTFTQGDQSSAIDPTTGEREDACCEDWDGDGFIDDSFGDTMRDLAPLIGPAANLWNASLSRSRPVLDIRGLDDLVNDPDVTVYGYLGYQYDAATETASVGPYGFEPETGIPLAAGRGYVEDGILHITDGYNRIALGASDSLLFIETRHWHLVGRLIPSTAGQGVGVEGVDDPRGARESGVVNNPNLISALNLHARDFCTCTTFTHPNEPVVDVATGTCQPAADRTPTCSEPDSFCGILTGPYCDVLLSSFHPDVDTDGDGRMDAISIGFFLTMAPMTYRGRWSCGQTP